MTLTAERVVDFAVPTFGAALLGAPCTVHGLEDHPHQLPMTRWSSPADASDTAVLSHCAGPVVDVGCGPGRMSEHLADRGLQVLGVDVVPEAVAQTRARGVSVLHRNVFDPLPGEGAWACVLLADGNIGIGGDPVRLLGRVAQLLAPGGRVVVDLAPPGSGLATRTVELECGGDRSASFPWSVMGPESVHDVAGLVGLDVDAVHEHEGRWFVVLVTPRVPR